MGSPSMTRGLNRAVATALTLAALAAPARAADVYRWIDGATVVYSDQRPPEGVILTSMPGRPALPVVTAPDAPPAEAAIPTPSEAEVVVSTRPATVDEIFELSGMRPQLPSIARALGAEYLPRPGQLGERDTVLVAQIVGRQFAPARLYAVIRDDFRRRVDQQQLAALAVWFRSPVGRPDRPLGGPARRARRRGAHSVRGPSGRPAAALRRYAEDRASINAALSRIHGRPLAVTGAGGVAR